MSLDEETVQEAKEERDHDEQHQRGEITQDENEHQPSFDASGRVEALGALRSAETVAVLAKHHECAATEVAGSFEVACNASESRQTDRLRLVGESRKERRAQRVRPRRRPDSVVDQAAADASLGDRDERTFDAPSARYEGFRPLDHGDQGAFRFGPSLCRGTVDTKRWQDEAAIRGGDDHERTDRNDEAHDRGKRRTGERHHELRPHEVALAPAKTTLGEVASDEQRSGESRRMTAGSESGEPHSDRGPRTTPQNRGAQSRRRENGSEDDQ